MPKTMIGIVDELRNGEAGWSGDAACVSADAAARGATEIERLRKGIQDYLDGNYEPKVGKIEKCPHGVYGYEVCENCIDKHFADLLRGNA